MKPSTAETQLDIFFVGLYYCKTHFIQSLSWVLPVLILFTDVEVHKLVICAVFAIFWVVWCTKLGISKEIVKTTKNRSSKYKDWPA